MSYHKVFLPLPGVIVVESVIVITYSKFDPYGNPIQHGSQPYGYTGEWWGSYIELLHLRARWYSPETGTFLSRDPIEGDELRSLTLNGWGYVEGNPINWVDPSGQNSCVLAGSMRGAGLLDPIQCIPEGGPSAGTIGKAVIKAVVTTIGVVGTIRTAIQLADSPTSTQLPGFDWLSGGEFDQTMVTIPPNICYEPKFYPGSTPVDIDLLHLHPGPPLEIQPPSSPPGFPLDLEIDLTNIFVAKRWKVGDPIDQVDANGNYPVWDTVRARYWKTRIAVSSPGEFGPSNTAIMELGFAPKVRIIARDHDTNTIVEKLISKDLHHIHGREGSRPHAIENLIELWPWEHEAIDSWRNLDYDFLGFK